MAFGLRGAARSVVELIVFLPRAPLRLFHGGCCFLSHGTAKFLSTAARTSLADRRLATLLGRKRARTIPYLSMRMVVGAATSSPCPPAPGCSTATALISLCS